MFWFNFKHSRELLGVVLWLLILATIISADCSLSPNGTGVVICEYNLPVESIPEFLSAEHFVFSDLITNNRILTSLNITTTSKSRIRTIDIVNCSIDFEDTEFFFKTSFDNLSISGSKLENLASSPFRDMDFIKVNFTRVVLSRRLGPVFQGARIDFLVLKSVSLEEVGSPLFKKSLVKSIDLEYHKNMTEADICDISPILQVLKLDMKQAQQVSDQTCMKKYIELREASFSNIPGSFKFLYSLNENLQSLSISSANAKDLDFTDYQNFHKNLKELSLAQSEISEINKEYYDSLTGLEKLDLSMNRLKRVPVNFKDIFSKLREVKLDGNELDCNCILLWFKDDAEVAHLNLSENTNCIYADGFISTVSDLSCTSTLTASLPSWTVTSFDDGSSSFSGDRGDGDGGNDDCSNDDNESHDVEILNFNYTLNSSIEEIVLRCMVRARPCANIRIEFPDGTIKTYPNQNFKYDFEIEVVVKMSAKSDFGKYTCHGVNNDGPDSEMSFTVDQSQIPIKRKSISSCRLININDVALYFGTMVFYMRFVAIIG